MLDLATCEPETYISLRDIAQRQHISVKYMEQIVSQLAKAGLVDSVRGPQGGYKLRYSAADYKVGDILRVTEGKLFPVWCLEDDTNSCPQYPNCTARNFWEGYYNAISQYMDNTTLQDLIDQKQTV